MKSDNMKSLSLQNKSVTRGTRLVPIGIPTICLYNFEPNRINILSKRKWRASHLYHLGCSEVKKGILLITSQK